MTPNCDSHTLYTLCTSINPIERQQGFRYLGDCLLPVARDQLNSRFDNNVVQDCVQEALQKIWQLLKAGKGPDSSKAFLAFAAKIVRRRCIDRYRYEMRRITEPIDGVEQAENQHNRALGAPEDLLPEEVYLISEQRLLLILAIKTHPKLNQNAKDVLIEGFLFEKTDDELAQQLNMTKANIRLIRHRALLLLREDDALCAALQ